MTEADYWRDKLNREAGQQDLIHQLRLGCAVEAAELNLVAVLKPRIFIDDNQWCVLYGENLQDGLAGFGDSLQAAIRAFSTEFYEPRPPTGGSNETV